ncbi:hypothetical protein [Streptomyces sp. cmx-4-9]|uniref:hypothetical protein n=1 Tax=Streptomyces sp. cmx-4-9 TaxID=2790941 RepID=UPI00397EFEF9
MDANRGERENEQQAAPPVADRGVPVDEHGRRPGDPSRVGADGYAPADAARVRRANDTREPEEERVREDRSLPGGAAE